jgi:hypothetical protein
LNTATLPQQKILHDEFSVAGRQWSTAGAAGYFAISGFWASLDFDDVVEGVAISAFEERLWRRRMARRVACQHKRPRSM